MFQPRPGVSLNFVRRESVTPEVAESVARSTIATLEVPGIFLADPAQYELIARYFTGADAPAVASVHAPFDSPRDLSSPESNAREAALGGARDSLDAAQKLGAKIVVVHPSSEPIATEDRSARLARSRESYQSLTAHARSRDCRIAAELLPRTCLGNTVDELLALLDGLDPEVFGVCLDTNHLMDRYESLPSVIRTLGSRLITLHLSDYDGVDEKHWMPGRGVIDWPVVLRALRDIDYTGPFNFESDPGMDDLHERIAAFEGCFEWLAGISEGC